VRTGVTARPQDVDMVVGQHGGDVPEQLRPVESLDLDGGDEHTDAVAVPLDLDDAIGVGRHEGGGVGAVGPVDGDASAARHEADDLVAGHGRAAPGESDHKVVQALDVHTDGLLTTRRPGL